MKPADRTEKQHRKQNGERSRRRTLEKRAFPSDKKQTNCKYGANFRQAAEQCDGKVGRRISAHEYSKQRCRKQTQHRGKHRRDQRLRDRAFPEIFSHKKPPQTCDCNIVCGGFFNYAEVISFRSPVRAPSLPATPVPQTPAQPLSAFRSFWRSFPPPFSPPPAPARSEWDLSRLSGRSAPYPF